MYLSRWPPFERGPPQRFERQLLHQTHAAPREGADIPGKHAIPRQSLKPLRCLLYYIPTASQSSLLSVYAAESALLLHSI